MMVILKNKERAFFKQTNYALMLVAAALFVVQGNVFAQAIAMPAVKVQANEGIKNADDVAKNTQYTITLSQFSASQLLQFQKFLRTYSAYQSDSIVAQNSISTQMSYYYGDSKALLLSNISKTAEHLGLQVLLRSAINDIDIRLVNVNAKSIPYKQW
jgi:hypothetical protein